MPCFLWVPLATSSCHAEQPTIPWFDWKTIATDWNRHLQPYETGCFNLRMLRFHRTWSSCYKHKVHWMIWLRISRLRLKKNGLSKILKRWFQWPSCESSRSTVWMEPSWSCATRQLMLHVCFANICIAKEKLLLWFHAQVDQGVTEQDKNNPNGVVYLMFKDKREVGNVGRESTQSAFLCIKNRFKYVIMCVCECWTLWLC